MDEQTLRKALSNIPLGGLRYLEKTGSTNDVALAWAADGAPDLALVIAGEQTAGRGRGNHTWFTAPRAALAFSLIFRPLPAEELVTPLFSVLGALAVCEVLAVQGFHPEIKWPNDVLLSRKKVCGVLAESIWAGTKVDSLVLGIGLNITHEALPPPDQLDFPATCLEVRVAHSSAECRVFGTSDPAAANPSGSALLARSGNEHCFYSCLGKAPGLSRRTGGNLGRGAAKQERPGGWRGEGWTSAPAFSTGPVLFRSIWGSAPASRCVIYFLP